MFSFILRQHNEKEEITFEAFVEEILKSEGLQEVADFKEAGTILTVKDGIVEVDGLDDAFSGELVRFESREYGMIMDLQTDLVKVVLLGEGLTLKPGQTV